eukprot:TRINITY_DN14353_c0_g1_i2.p5 TRINITY_DN14353_c0_g1~~TRINITY_DN14353_c0_g1_i2.p5  ORF type:complete len:150 (-),score=2.00 TRINITY_DN14353_c0_g1_i2:462-911(-)
MSKLCLYTDALFTCHSKLKNLKFKAFDLRIIEIINGTTPQYLFRFLEHYGAEHNTTKFEHVVFLQHPIINFSFFLAQHPGTQCQFCTKQPLSVDLVFFTLFAFLLFQQSSINQVSKRHQIWRDEKLVVFQQDEVIVLFLVPVCFEGLQQ